MDTNIVRRKSVGRRVIVYALIMLMLTIYIVPHGSYDAYAAIKSSQAGALTSAYLAAGAGGKYYSHPHHASYSGLMAKNQIITGGATYDGFCVKGGAPLPAMGASYTAYTTGTSKYWKNELSAAKREMLESVAIYGWQKGKTSPAGNINDYFMATAVLVWEIQEGKRTTLAVKAGTSSEYSFIKGTNAATCYLKILENIRDYNKGASFTEASSGAAKTYTMKHSYGSNNSNAWSLELTDKNELHRMKVVSAGTGNTVTVPKSPSWDYKIKRTAATNGSTITFAPNYSSGTSQPLIIWERGSYQPLLMGANADDTRFYVKVATEDPGTGKIKKTVTDGKALSGFKFTVKGTSGTATAGYTGSATTNASGEISLTLYPGKYTVTEDMTVAKAKGYELVTPAQSQTITITAGKTSTVNFKNDPNKGTGRIVKTVTDGKNLTGFRFTVAGKAGTATAGYSSSVLTNVNGEISLTLSPGTYTVTEDMAVAKSKGYELVTPAQSQAITITANKTSTVSFKNDPNKGKCRIVKTVTDAGSLAGFKFTIAGKAGTATAGYSKTVVTPATGIIEESLTPGVYTVKEDVATANERGYVTITPEASQTLTVEKDKTVLVNFKNAPPDKHSINIIKETDDGGSVGEFKFNVYRLIAAGTPLTEEDVINRAGVAGADEGTVSVNGDDIDVINEAIAKCETGEFEVRITGDVTTLTIITPEPSEDESDAEDEPDTEDESDAEDEPEPEEIFDSNTETVTKTITVYLRTTGDTETTEVTPDTDDGFTVCGFDYPYSKKIYDKNFVTDDLGEIKIDLGEDDYGTYTVTEIMTSAQEARYHQPAAQTKTASKTGSAYAIFTFTNEAKKGDLKITKTAEDGIIKDVKFLVEGMDKDGLDATAVAPFTAATDENGIIAAATKGLLIGYYKITELLAEGVEEDYYVPQKPRIVEIKNNETTEVSFYNDVNRGDLKITKTSEDGLVGGIEFLVEGMDWNGADTSEISVMTKTDGAGIIKIMTFPDNEEVEIAEEKSGEDAEAAEDVRGLAPGFYTVTEMPIEGADEDYYLPQEPQIIEIKNNETTEADFHNDVNRGDLKIIKTSDDGRVEDIDFLIEGMDNDGVDASEISVMARTDKDGVIEILTFPVEKETEEELGAEPEAAEEETEFAAEEFELTEEEAEEDSDEETTDESDEETEIIEEVRGLAPGFYTVTEMSIEGVDENYYVPQEPQIIEIKNNETTEVGFHNNLAPTSMIVSKQSATTGEELPGAALSVWTIGEDGGRGEMVEEWTSTENPYEVLGLDYQKTYILHEELAPSGYELAQDVEFTVGDTEKVTMMDEQTTVLYRKLDYFSGVMLEGCEAQIIDPETNEVIAELKSSDEANIPVNLVAGKTYVMHEKKAPDGYDLTTDVVFVASNNTVVELRDKPKVAIEGDTENFGAENGADNIAFDSLNVKTGEPFPALMWLLVFSICGAFICGALLVRIIRNHRRWRRLN